MSETVVGSKEFILPQNPEFGKFISKFLGHLIERGYVSSEFTDPEIYADGRVVNFKDAATDKFREEVLLPLGKGLKEDNTLRWIVSRATGSDGLAAVVDIDNLSYIVGENRDVGDRLKSMGESMMEDHHPPHGAKPKPGADTLRLQLNHYDDSMSAGNIHTDASEYTALINLGVGYLDVFPAGNTKTTRSKDHEYLGDEGEGLASQISIPTNTSDITFIEGQNLPHRGRSEPGQTKDTFVFVLPSYEQAQEAA